MQCCVVITTLQHELYHQSKSALVVLWVKIQLFETVINSYAADRTRNQETRLRDAIEGPRICYRDVRETVNVRGRVVNVVVMQVKG